MWSIGYMVKLSLDKQGAFALSVHPYNIEFDGTRINLFIGKKKAKFNTYLAEISAIIKDEDKTQKMFDAWVAIHGKTFLQYYTAFIDLDSFDKDPKEIPTSPAARNLLTCEAHNELLTTQMSLYLDGRLDEAKELIPEINRLDNPHTQGFL
jgi:hypothetical protein